LLAVSVVWLYYYYERELERQLLVKMEKDRADMQAQMKVLSESNPRVLMWENFLTPEECDHIIERSKPEFERSAVANPDRNNNKDAELSKVNSVRTSSGAWISKKDSDEVIKKFVRRVSVWSELPVKNGEDVQVLRYEVGQEYKTHYDFFDPVHFQQYLENGGQRIASVLCFLNDVPVGGHTEFPKKKISVKPKKGSAILWYNAFLNGTLDRNSEHGGRPVMEGEKYVAVQWMREKARR